MHPVVDKYFIIRFRYGFEKDMEQIELCLGTILQLNMARFS